MFMASHTLFVTSLMVRCADVASRNFTVTGSFKDIFFVPNTVAEACNGVGFKFLLSLASAPRPTCSRSRFMIIYFRAYRHKDLFLNLVAVLTLRIMTWTSLS